MPKVAVYDLNGAKQGEIELSDAIFAIEPNAPVMHQVIVAQLAAKRQGTQSALTRSEVSGGGKKPYRQKGTGRARQGSTRSPQWRHGGMVFAVKPRSYTQKVNKKVRRLAMKSAFSAKAQENEIIVVQNMDIDGHTKSMAAALKALGVDRKALVVTEEINENLRLASGNLAGIKPALINTLNVYDIMTHDKFVITVEAVNKLQEVYV